MLLHTPDGMAGKVSYGKSIKISEQIVFQQGKYFNRHGREMGYTGKAEYEAGAINDNKEWKYYATDWNITIPSGKKAGRDY